MNSKFVRVGLTTCVLVLAFGGLLWSTLRDGTEYYKHVEEVSGQPDAWYGKKLQLHGYVVPDSFKDEAEVVLKGTLTPSGFTVEPNGVMAKCPSKYEAKPGTAAARPGL